MLPKLEEFCRDDSPMSFDELSAVSKKLGSLICLKGFDFDTSQFDVSSLIFPSLKEVKVVSENESDLKFIVNVLENSIPQGRGFLKSLVVRRSLSIHPSTNPSVQLSTSLINIIEVRISLSNEEGIA
jgi:hypothetical protein